MSSSVQQSSSSSNQRTQYSYNRYTTVQRGDSVYRIAARNGMSAQELARLNNVSVNTPLRPGQQIRVR
ncbi:LysM domain-containing protein [Limosilactobacillus panis]|uniref:LysM peptidoglycan-binding domain-containing protein n=1 Tax=Limosilactobacillus panis TaxID=47493 RepID=UPI0021BBD63F|nr:LysM domain-containing protein [Limosilactobacillus panis]